MTPLNYTTLLSFAGLVGRVAACGWRQDRPQELHYLVSLLAISLGPLYPHLHDAKPADAGGLLLDAFVHVFVVIACGLYVPEQFSTQVRMRGVGFYNTAGRMMTILAPQLTVPLFAALSVAGASAWAPPR